MTEHRGKVRSNNSNEITATIAHKALSDFFFLGFLNLYNLY